MSSFFSSFSFWDWLDIFGLLTVSIGCAGELWLVFKKFPYNPTHFPALEAPRRKLEITFLIILVFGLSCELVALPISLHQSHVQIETLRNDNALLFTIGEEAKESAAQANTAAETARAERARFEKE